MQQPQAQLSHLDCCAAGRYADDLTAAKAYDKAAVYLYGRNAITNFGLEACRADPTEVGGLLGFEGG
jgi:hypothetical protein